jgi:hypothetical protein
MNREATTYIFILLCFSSLFIYHPNTSKIIGVIHPPKQEYYTFEKQHLYGYSEGEILERTDEVQEELLQVQEDLREYKKRKRKK